jgi:nicotinamidase/pyrazinamidase
MDMPKYYDPGRVGELYRPDVLSITDAGQALGLTPSDDDNNNRVLLLIVDPQVDFVHPQGTLSVPGAVEDTRRTIEWIYRNMDSLSTIAVSLDSHVPIQIFFPTWWRGLDGNHPAPYTVITSQDLANGRWSPIYEPEWSEEYVERLEEQAKKALMVWPYHTLIGTQGHNVMPALYEAVVYHTAARQAQPIFITKGSIPKTEHYSMLEPEVKVPDHPQGVLNLEFVQMLAAHDAVYIAGQAKSHCVLETVASLMRHFQDRPEIIAKLRVLMDATSSVVHPEIDFEAMARTAYAEFERAGLKLVRSDEPIAETSA